MTRLALVACLAALSIPAWAVAQQQPAPSPATAVAQQQPATPAARAAPASRNNPEKLVCTTVKSVGSRIGTRTCRSQAQAAQDKHDAELLIERTRGMKEQEIVVAAPGGG